MSIDCVIFHVQQHHTKQMNVVFLSPAVTEEATKAQPFEPQQANMNSAIYYQIKF